MSKICSKCGTTVADDVKVCPSCHQKLQSSSEKVNITSDDLKSKQINSKIKFRTILISCSSLLFLVICGIFLYYNILLPRKIDKNAPRYYTFAPSVILRSSMTSGADYNKIGSLPYGTELIAYNVLSDWTSVKVNSSNSAEHKLKGYVATDYILEKKEFFRLNSIFADAESRTIINTAKCRLALLNYFISQEYVGNISPELCLELGLPEPNSENVWLVHCLNAESGQNYVYFKRLYRQSSKYTDFAVLIRNQATGERKLLYFYFEDDGTPYLLEEKPAPEFGYIKKIDYRYEPIFDEYYLDVDYSM